MSLEKTELATFIKWNDVKPGESISGEIKSISQNLAGNGPVVFLKGEQGPIALPLPSTLAYILKGSASGKFAPVAVGDFIKVTYAGRSPSINKPAEKDPKKWPHKFKYVEVDRASK